MSLTKLTMKIKHFLFQKNDHTFVLINDVDSRKSSFFDSNLFIQKNQKIDTRYLIFRNDEKENYRENHINVRDFYIYEKKHFQNVDIENDIEFNNELRAKFFNSMTLFFIHSRYLFQNTLY